MRGAPCRHRNSHWSVYGRPHAQTVESDPQKNYIRVKKTDRVQHKRFEYWQVVQGILAKDLIFTDEAGVNLAMTRLFARAPKGQRAHGKRLNKRGKNVSLIGAISLNRVITQLPSWGLLTALPSRLSFPKSWFLICGKALVSS